MTFGPLLHLCTPHLQKACRPPPAPFPFLFPLSFVLLPGPPLVLLDSFFFLLPCLSSLTDRPAPRAALPFVARVLLNATLPRLAAFPTSAPCDLAASQRAGKRTERERKAEAARNGAESRRGGTGEEGERAAGRKNGGKAIGVRAERGQTVERRGGCGAKAKRRGMRHGKKKEKKRRRRRKCEQTLNEL